MEAITYIFENIGQTVTLSYYSIQVQNITIEGNSLRIAVRYKKTNSMAPTQYLQFNDIAYIYPDV